MKLEHGTPNQVRIVFIVFGVLIIISELNDLYSDSDESLPRRARWMWELIDAVFGKYGDEVFGLVVGFYLIYCGIFKFDSIKRKYKNMSK